MSAITVQKKNKKAVVECRGKMTINESNEVRTGLLEAFNLADVVLLNLDKVQDVDLTFLQLICSAHRTAILDNKQFTIENKPLLFKSFVEEAGFLRNSGCIKNPGGICFWMQEENNE